MSSLSWMIYWAGVVQNLQGLFIGLCGIGTFGSVVLLVFGLDGDRKLLRYLRYTIPTALLFAFLAVFTPDKNTLYAIAASEMGEQVLQTPEASKARQALNAWLDQQIANAKAEK